MWIYNRTYTAHVHVDEGRSLGWTPLEIEICMGKKFAPSIENEWEKKSEPPSKSRTLPRKISSYAPDVDSSLLKNVNCNMMQLFFAMRKKFSSIVLVLFISYYCINFFPHLLFCAVQRSEGKECYDLANELSLFCHPFEV